MPWNLKEHGESLEREASDFISEYLPSYELIWSSFIGHQGNGKMAATINISPENDKLRKDFAEHHYTILESVYFMYMIAKEEEEAITQITNFEQYRRLMNSLIAFYAYSGRIKDNLFDCYSIVGYPKKAKDPTADIKVFYEARNNFLHGKKVPFSIDESGFYSLPRLATNEFQHGWNEDSLWEEAMNIQKELVTESMFSAFSKMAPRLNELLYDLFDKVKRFKEKNGIELSLSEDQPLFKKGVKSLHFITTASGTILPPSSGVTSLVDVYGFMALENQKKWKK